MDALLTRRLDRLKSAARPTSREFDRRAPPDYAGSLAAALDGHASRGIVVLERSFHVPLDRPALGSLPYPAGSREPLVCLDLETTGLATAAGTLAFLVGLGIWDGDQLAVRQLLLPDHAAEAAWLDAVVEALPGDAWLVTYNGRSFDWPLLVARYRLHRRDPPSLAGHLDLLPIARALWKHRLGSARLGMVEQALCGVERHDDLPGALVPERYFAYLRTRRGELLRTVVEHNRQDIVSLSLLLQLLAGGLAAQDGWATQHPGDLAGFARRLARLGRPAEALQCVEVALASERWERGFPEAAALRRRLTFERARLLARLGRREEAVAAWHEIATRGGPGAAEAWVRVARHREHVLRDAGGAIEACREAAAAAQRSRLWGRPLPWLERDLAKRLARLRRVSLARAA
jgi:uncharacterized protein YprB with RNaseH-like and TPR domain